MTEPELDVVRAAIHLAAHCTADGRQAHHGTEAELLRAAVELCQRELIEMQRRQNVENLLSELRQAAALTTSPVAFGEGLSRPPGGNAGLPPGAPGPDGLE